MYKNIIDSRLIFNIGEYGIIRVKEESRFDNGTLLGTSIWYDVCLDHGNGDIVYSSQQLEEAKQWAKENM